MKNLTLPYWGRISHIVSEQKTAVFLCQDSTELYRLDFSKDLVTLDTDVLPTPMTAMTAMPDGMVILLGDDGKLYQTNFQGKKLKALSQETTFALMGASDDTKKPNAVAMVGGDDVLLVLYPEWLLAWRYEKHTLGAFIGAFAQTSATALALCHDGKWLVVGDSSGTVSSYQNTGETLVLGSSEALHTGEITALAFEPNSQQFFSAAADKRLLRTHVQGKLQGIDRAKASGHSQMVRALWVNGQRLYTGSDDKTVKTWQFDKGQPTTAKGDLSKVKALTQVQYLEQAHLVVVGTDESLRLIPLDKDGKALELSCVIKDGYQRLQNHLSDSDDDFKEALRLLDNIKDKKAFDLVKTALGKTTDGFRREALTTWVAGTSLNQTSSLLLDLMSKNSHEKVRSIAFDALKQRVIKEDGSSSWIADKLNRIFGQKQQADKDSLSWGDLHFLQVALECQFVDICRLAIAEYARLAKKHTHLTAPIIQALQQALGHRLSVIGKTALATLETLLPDDDPQADLWALSANDGAIIQAGLIRLYQRNLLGSLEVKRQIALLQNHDDLQVRQTALYVAILTQPKLAAALKHSDDNFTLVLQDFTDFQLQDDKKGVDLGLGGALAVDGKSDKHDAVRLSDEVLEPLLQGLGNAHADISFRSAYALALLFDERALGALLRLMSVKDDDIRLGVAKALGELGAIDGLAVLPILFNDKNSAVRLSAFLAYQKLANDDLATINVAMQSAEEDIHQKALALLLKCSQGKKISHATLQILTEALNNPFASVRQEVVKVLINQMANKTLDETLTLLTQSDHVDVHQVALGLWQTQVKQPATQMDAQTATLAQFLSSRFGAIRQEALDFACKENKRFSLKAVIDSAFASGFVDVRKQGLNLLNKHKSPELLPLVVALLNDEDHELRLAALTVALGFDDASVLTQGLSSPYDDIRLASAKALARLGDDSGFAVFEEFLNTPAPKDRPKDEMKLWLENITSALTGLVLLGDGRGFAWFKQFLTSQEHDFGNMATFLAYVSSPDALDDLASLTKNEHAKIKDGANLALAIWGDKRGTPFLTQKAPLLHVLQARNGLGIAHAHEIKSVLNHQDVALAGVLLLIFYDLTSGAQTPSRLLEALTMVDESSAVLLSGVLARYHEADKVWDYLSQSLNSDLNHQRQSAHDYQKREKAWDITAQMLQDLARFALFAPATVRASAVDLLCQISAEHTFSAWQSHWLLLVKRYQSQVPPLSLNIGSQNSKQHQAIAFGSLLGIVRQCDYRHVAVGLKSLRQLACLAQDNKAWQDGVIRALLSFLNHEHFSVRELSWELLQKLGADSRMLAQSAIRSSYADMVRVGLPLWQSVAGSADKLADLLQTSSPDLAEETYQLLVKQMGKLQASLLALNAHHLPLRRRVTQSWSSAPDVDEQLTFVQTAVNNDDWHTSFKALSLLLIDIDTPKVDKAQYLDRMFDLLQNSPDQSLATWQVLPLIGIYYKDDAAGRLLAYLDNPHKKVPDANIYQTIGEMRDVKVVDALLEHYAQKTSEKNHIFRALLVISGFNQSIQDYDDESGDKRWLDRQYPRHADVLLKMMSLALAKTHYQDFMEELKNVAWVADEAYRTDIDGLLLRAFKQLPKEYTNRVVKAMSYRVQKRKGDLTGLRLALGNKDPEVQFWAAEGLAKCGVKDGFAVLMATIDYNSDYFMRRNAVLALGHLGDENAYEKLLKLAEDSEHALQDVASEALGHLGSGEHGVQIFKLLEKCVQADSYGDDPALKHWLNGLRWLNTPQSWQLIRQVITKNYDAGFGYTAEKTDPQLHAITLLKHHDDPQNRELLLELLRHNDDVEVVKTAHTVASLLWGGASDVVYEYDWATLSGHCPLMLDRSSLTRVTKHASLNALVDFILNQQTSRTLKPEISSNISAAILSKKGLPAAMLDKLLNNDAVLSQKIALQYLIQYPSDYWSKALQDQVTKQLQHLQDVWTEHLSHWQKDSSRIEQDRGIRQEVSTLMQSYLWLLLRHGQQKTDVVGTLTWLLHQGGLSINQATDVIADVHHAWLRQALLALTARDDDMIKACRDVLLGVSSWASVELDELARALIAKMGVAQDLPVTPHAQLLTWVQTANVPALFDMANNKTLDEALRIGAIEALGQLNVPEVDKRLSDIKNSDPDSDIQKAAFAALRRYERRQVNLQKLAAMSVSP